MWEDLPGSLSRKSPEMDPVERANREAELAHELEELKVSVREREDAIHAMPLDEVVR